MHQFVGSDHGQWLQIGRNIHNDGQQTVEQGLQLVIAAGDQFVENLNFPILNSLYKIHNYDEIRVCSRENGHIK